MRVDDGARLVHFGRRGQEAILECALYVANSRHDWSLRRGQRVLNYWMAQFVYAHALKEERSARELWKRSCGKSRRIEVTSAFISKTSAAFWRKARWLPMALP